MGWNLDLAYLMVLKVAMLFASELLFCKYLPKRNRFALRFLMGTLAGLILAFLIPIDWGTMVSSGTVVFFAHVLISCGWLYLLYEIDIKTLLFIVSMGKITTSVAGILEFPLGILFPDLGVYYTTMFSREGVLFVIRAAAALLITLLIMYVLFARKYTNYDISDRWKPTLWMTLVMIFIIDVFVQMVFAEYIEQGPTDIIQLVYQLIKLFMHVFIILLLNTIYINSQTQKELDHVRLLWNKAESQYALSRENVEAINKKCHDLKHRILALKTRDNQDTFRDIYREIEIYDSRINTGNEALDVVFSEKSLICVNKQIYTEFMINGSELDFIDPTDLFVLFGNMMDNCIEAVEKLDVDDRYILCNVFTEAGIVMIHTSNPYAGDLTMNHDRPETTKKDRQNHGYGMLSIEDVVRKYSGELSIQAEQGRFQLDILIPKPPNKAK